MSEPDLAAQFAAALADTDKSCGHAPLWASWPVEVQELAVAALKSGASRSHVARALSQMGYPAKEGSVRSFAEAKGLR